MLSQAHITEAAAAWWFGMSQCDPGGPGYNVVCCCFLEQETLLTLLQLTQLYNGYLALW